MRNKFVRSLGLLLLPFIITAFAGCSNPSDEIDFKGSNLAVMETSTFNSTSYIKLYDASGKEQAEKSVDCADINSGFLSPVTCNNKVYVNSIGGYSNRSKKVLEFDLQNNKISSFEIAAGILSVAANSNYVYTTYSPPVNSIITKYDTKKNASEGTVKVPGVVQNINFTNNKIYAFSTPSNRIGTLISIVNPNTLKVEKYIKDMSGQGVFDSVAAGDSIYYTHMTSSDGKNPSKILTKLNLKDDTLSNIELSEEFPDHLKIYKNNLYITHYNSVANLGNKLTILNLDTNKKTVLGFNHKLFQIEVGDNKLYSCDKTNMYIYNINNFKLINEFKVMDDRKDYKVKGFFLTK